MILDYSTLSPVEKGASGIVNFLSIDTNAPLFKHDSTCPFCKKKIDSVAYQKRKHDTPEWLFGTFDQSEAVVQCPECGWWEYKYFQQSDAVIDGIRATEIEYCSAVLRSFNDNSIQIPIDSLREQILKNPEKIYKIDAHKMEDLVRSVFSDFYPGCTVKKFGQTRDGGRDGLLIDEHGKQFLISIKRRESPNTSESVSTLRDLVGATVVQDSISGCIVVSTANHFTKPAKDYAQQVLSKNFVETFDLIDCKEFLRITDLTRDKLPKAWEKLLKL